MARAQSYEKSTSFGAGQNANPTDPLPAASIDAELEALSAVIDDHADAIADVRRDDGALQNEIVTEDSLHPDVVSTFSTAASLAATAAVAAALAAGGDVTTIPEATEGVSALMGVSAAGTPVVTSTVTVGADRDAEPGLHFNNVTHAPELYAGVTGSVGKGSILIENTRTGGYGQYGEILISNVVTAATVTGELDTALTSWITHTNIVGGQVFGGWIGANTPAKDFDTFSSGAAIGLEVNVGNRWGDEGLKTDIGSGRWQVGLQVVPDPVPSRSTRNWQCTISNASPAVVSRVAHGLPANTPVVFTTTGALPTGITAGTVYFVSETDLTADTFKLKTAIVSGSAVNTSSAGSGSHYYKPSHPSSFGIAIGRSIWHHKWWVGMFLRGGTIMPGGYGMYMVGSQVAADDQPAAIIKSSGYWENGIDFRGVVFGEAALHFDYTHQTSATATAGSVASPGNFARFLVAYMSGTEIKIPYFLA